MSNSIADILGKIKESYASPIINPALERMGLNKSTFSQPNSATSGLNYYDLELGAKFLVPVLTPLRNEIPRVTGKGGIQANWRAITGINTTGMRLGVSGGNRGGVMAISTQDYTAAYRGIGLEDNVDFEAEYAAQGFDDLRSQAALRLLQATMIGEEAIILGGSTSLALGTTPTPTLTASSTGGTLPTETLSVVCVAMSLDGLINGSVSGGIQAQITRTNPDQSSDTFGGGTATKSSNATVAVTGATGSVSASVTAVKGAYAYAWFWGLAGSETLGAITTINSIVITAAATGTQLASSLPGGVDSSYNSLVFDGLLTIASKGLGSYYVAQPTGTAGTGTPLTADGAGGILEIDTALQWFWDNLRLSPQTLWVNSQEAKNISRKIIAGNANSAQRFVFNASQDALGGGVAVRTYLNRFGMNGATTLDIRTHPNMPAGTILFDTKMLPYPVSNVGNVRQVRCRQDYYQLEWPLRSRKYEYGVYADEVLQHYFPPSLGVITNIGNG
jgi:hypothetical protein